MYACVCVCVCVLQIKRDEGNISLAFSELLLLSLALSLVVVVFVGTQALLSYFLIQWTYVSMYSSPGRGRGRLLRSVLYRGNNIFFFDISHIPNGPSWPLGKEGKVGYRPRVTSLHTAFETLKWNKIIVELNNNDTIIDTYAGRARGKKGGV